MKVFVDGKKVIDLQAKLSYQDVETILHTVYETANKGKWHSITVEWEKENTKEGD